MSMQDSRPRQINEPRHPYPSVTTEFVETELPYRGNLNRPVQTRKATVTAVNYPYVTISLNGTTHTGVGFLESYSPHVNDYVVCLYDGVTPFIIGRVGQGGPYVWGYRNPSDHTLTNGWQVVANSDVTVYVPRANMSILVTIDANIVFSVSGAVQARVEAQFDGNFMGGPIIYGNEITGTRARTWRQDNPSVGNHTARIATIKDANAGTATLIGGESSIYVRSRDN